MTVEKLQRADIPALLDLHEELVGYRGELTTAQRTYEDILADEDYVIYVAKEEGHGVIGSAMGLCCKSLASDGKSLLVIEDVIVTQKLRGKGIGRALFEALDAFALQKNCSYSILVSSGHRKEAHAFYERMGFDDDVRGFRKNY